MTFRTLRLIGCCLTLTVLVADIAMAGPRSGGSVSKPAVKAPTKSSASGEVTATCRDSVTATMDTDQKDNIDSLTSQLTALQTNSDVTDEQKTKLADDLKVAMEGAQKPSEESVTTLTTDLVEYAADGTLTPKEIIAIQKDVKAVLNSANITDEDIEALKGDVKAIAESSNMTEEDVASLVATVETIARTAQTNAQATAESAPTSVSEITKPTLRR